MVVQETIYIDTQASSQWVNITDSVRAVVRASSISRGSVTITSAHTTAAVTVNESADPAVETDVFTKLSQLIPSGEPFYLHAEGNSHSHLQATLVGASEVLPVQKGGVVLGTWQAIYFCEFDGPRKARRCTVTVMGE
ncbi:secondary thiamine-phosphate synthase enzyme YjbQ [Chitinivibrio alkaliphilus]|uniref:Secondary thiamine-phosphate synthase enzyme n=1 Tax=Chitinivibrio alkaliphilus ACht1 TaxID=1313304 RepID=U7D939_9BACT|nr:secondary thiamine-phosphate synthase enzyme YjbQ [Chitinivibrio alkaliphilus]ERP31612.1 hypothetical protein CALK_1476 [Chitinivibrio alkaliphilus ACht1]